MANLKRGLIVSCQAVKGEPLFGCNMMHHFARAAVAGGAVGIRANYVADINAIRGEVSVPMIGIIKKVYEDKPDVYITPTLNEVKDLLTTGIEVIALDCTNRERPLGTKLSDLVAYIREHSPQTEIMADCDTLESAEVAHELGFDYIGTTMRGYTPLSKQFSIPDYDFVSTIVKKYPDTKIVAEGGIWERDQLNAVSKLGVYAIVVGSSITRPKDITERFVGALELC
ncbi:MAG: N-acetylmannosamine-6-phosphate 2-epimerase [Bacillota bacterium]